MDTSREIKISIIVPIYKVEDYLDRCISSLVKQTYKNIEVILVDDGSPDRCPQMCDEWSAKDNRIIVIHKANGGLSDARNAGIKSATGEYLMFVDSDDYIELDSCEAFAKIVNRTEADIIVGEAIQESQSHVEYVCYTNLIEGKIYSNAEFMKIVIKAKEWYAPACFLLYKRDLFISNNLEYVKELLHEDMEMLPRIFFAAKTVSYLHKEFYHYELRDDSIMGKANLERNGHALMQIYKEWKQLFDDVEDKELQKLLYGNLSKHYLHTVRMFKIRTKNNITGIDDSFLIKYGLDGKEKIKAIVYAVAPGFFIKL